MGAGGLNKEPLQTRRAGFRALGSEPICRRQKNQIMRDAKQWWAETGGSAIPTLLVGNARGLEDSEQTGAAKYRVIFLDGTALSKNPTLKPSAVCVWSGDAGGATGGTTRLVPAPSGGAQSTANAADTVEMSDAPEGAGEAERAAFVMAFLAGLGAKTIRTAGLDFGAGPMPDVLAKNDRLARVIQERDLLAGPIAADVPARIFIGVDESQMLGAKVLEYSIRKHATLSVQFDTMRDANIPKPQDPKNEPRTQFSYNRFTIPKRAGYHGRALYVDADMLVFADLRELWETPFDGATVLHAPPSAPDRPKQTSVMLLNCDALTWDVPAIIADLDAQKYDYDGLMRDMVLEPDGAVRENLPIEWNSLEEYHAGKTRLIHYTDMKTQPWVSRKNKNGDLWVQSLLDALADGFIKTSEVEQAIKDGFVRPSLGVQITLAPALWPAFLHTAGPLLDARYKPHRALRQRLSKVGM